MVGSILPKCQLHLPAILLWFPSISYCSPPIWSTPCLPHRVIATQKPRVHHCQQQTPKRGTTTTSPQTFELSLPDLPLHSHDNDTTSTKMSFNVAPLTIPPKGAAAPAVVMDVSPGKCTNTCPKENCAIHAAKVDNKELADIMGRLSLSDVTNNNNKPRSGPLPGLGVTIPRPMSSPFIRKPKVKYHFVRHAQVSYFFFRIEVDL